MAESESAGLVASWQIRKEIFDPALNEEQERQARLGLSYHAVKINCAVESGSLSLLNAERELEMLWVQQSKDLRVRHEIIVGKFKTALESNCGFHLKDAIGLLDELERQWLEDVNKRHQSFIFNLPGKYLPEVKEKKIKDYNKLLWCELSVLDDRVKSIKKELKRKKV